MSTFLGSRYQDFTIALAKIDDVKVPDPWYNILKIIHTTYAKE